MPDTLCIHSELGSDIDLLENINPDDVDWASVAKQAVSVYVSKHGCIHMLMALHKFNNRKLPTDCCQRWTSFVRPSVNLSAWSKDEAKKLMQLGKEFRGRQWKEVSNQIGVNNFTP